MLKEHRQWDIWLISERRRTRACNPPALRDTGPTYTHTQGQARTHTENSHLVRACMHSRTRTYPVTAMKRERGIKKEGGGDDDSLKLRRQRNLSYHITHIRACEASVPLSLYHPRQQSGGWPQKSPRLNEHKSRD